MSTHSFFAVSPPGIEAITAGELISLDQTADLQMSLSDIKAEEGGVSFRGTWRDGMIANIALRTASRVLYRLSSFHASHFNQLIKQVSALKWEEYVDPLSPVSVRVTCKKSKLYHSDAVAERVCEGIQKRLQRKISIEPWSDTVDSPPQLIIVRLIRDQCSISLDMSGAPLYHRGYRKETAKAPLREHLAAAMILSSGWDKKSPLVDPFCGSGTFLIEAALLARNQAPGLDRSFSVERWPVLDVDKQALSEILKSQIRTSEELILLGYDRDQGAVEIAQRNAVRGKVDTSIHFQRQAISDFNPSENPGWIITNPPYGLRVSPSQDLRNLYARFGDVLRKDFSGWHVMVLTSDPGLIRMMKIPFKRAIQFENGGLRVQAFSVSLG